MKMESDSTHDNQKAHSDLLSDDGDVPEPSWVRRSSRINHGIDRFILVDYGYFLCGVSILLWALLLAQWCFL